MSKFKRYYNPLAAAVALTSITLNIPAFALDQNDTAKSKTVVSARHRDENLQEVPISMSVFSGEQLEQKNLTNLVQVGAITPNTTLELSSGTNTTLVAYIRGVGESNPTPGRQSSVGIYLDGVYLNRPQGAALNIYDLERIEILRGPQGTLYGRNTSGGAIKYISKRLADSPELSIKGSLGTYKQQDLVVTGSLPVIADTLKIGGSIASFNRDGFGENTTTGENFNEKDVLATRASIEFTPTDALFVRLAADYTKDNSGSKFGHRTTPSQQEFDNDGNQYQPLDDVFDSRSGASQVSHPISENTYTASGLALTFDYSITDTLSFKSISAYREDEKESINDYENLPLTGMIGFTQYENDQLSQEFRLVFEGDKIQGVAGLYYLDTNALMAADRIFRQFSFDFTGFSFIDTNTKHQAAFIDVNIDISDSFSIAIGSRYSKDELKALVANGLYLSQTMSPYFNDGTINRLTAFEGKRKDSAFTPNLSLNWKPSDTHSFYTSYSRGNKAGGFTLETKAFGQGFESETVATRELGMKSVMFDGRLSYNLAIFRSDYTDIQSPGSRFVDTNGDGFPDDFIRVTTNLGKARIQGAEFELNANVFDNFYAGLALGLIDAKYTEYRINSISNEDFSDDYVIPNTPEKTAGLNLSYHIAIGEGELSLNSSANYTSETHQFGQPSNAVDQSGYTLFDANITWTSGNEHWRASLNGANLSDKEYIVSGNNLPGLRAGSTSAFYGNPRTVTATVKYSF